MCAAELNRARSLSQIAVRRFLAGFCLSSAFAATAAELVETRSSILERPLAPRAGRSGETLFAEVPAEHSGVVLTNVYDDPRMWRERYHEFGVGAIGTGVAIGDFDRDGLADLFIASKLESCRLFRNLGDWKFEDVTERAGVTDDSREWKQGVAFADVNNDGWLDLYVCRFGVPNLLFVNQGDGTFREEAEARGLAIVDASSMAAFEDYDRDGWLDVYLQTNLRDAGSMPDGQPDYLFRNRGDGTFEEVTESAGISRQPTQGHSASWWDYNGDGWPDLYVANDFQPPDFLYRNKGDGTFEDVIGEVVPHMPFSSMGSDSGDINNDGRIDFLVADMAATSHEKDQRGMADSRSRHQETEPGSPSKAIQLVRNSLYVNTGVGRCLETAYLSGLDATDWTWSLRFEDFDNDGRVDLHVTNGMNREQHNLDLIHAMFRSETAQGRARLMHSAPILNEANLAFRNLGDLQFEEVGAEWGLDQAGVSFGAATGDLDNDGDLDLVYVNFQRGPTLLRNESNEGRSVVFSLRGSDSNRYGVGAVVRIQSASGQQIRRLTLARGYHSTTEPILHFGLGQDERVDQLSVWWPSGRVQEFQDLPTDRAYVLTEPESGERLERPPVERAIRTQFREVGAALGLALAAPEEMLEGTVNQPLLSMRFNRRGPGLAVADLEGDPREEIVLAGTNQREARVLRKQGDAYQEAPGQSALELWPVNDGPPLVFDADGDGRNDLLLTSGGAVFPAEDPEYEPRLYLNSGEGVLRPAPRGALPSMPNSAGAAAAADFDRDGHLDVFVGGRVAPGYYPESPYSALLVNKGGRFADATDDLAPELREVGMVTSALWSDVDQDGWIDLLVALDWGTIRYFRNDNGREFEDLSDEAGFADAGAGWWRSLASGDFNGDGRPDFVAGNVGLNTQFSASPDQPEVLFYADFADSGAPQLARGYYENGRLLPRASRGELAEKIPSVRDRFPKNNDYAAATLEEILGKDALASATRLEASELRSGVFLSQPDGRFRFAPLPTLAQVAPLQGMVTADFDGDGNCDILAVQNSYAPMPFVGRFDGGLGCFLRGDGEGGFSAVSPQESGIVVPGDGEALVVLDLNDDAWPDVLATRNNTTAMAFENAGSAERHPLSLRLEGGAGNRSAIGARVELEMSDGTVQWREVQAGSGRYSQSTSTLFFGYENGNAPAKARVRWPTGAASEHELSAEARTLTISQKR